MGGTLLQRRELPPTKGGRESKGEGAVGQGQRDMQGRLPGRSGHLPPTLYPPAPQAIPGKPPPLTAE